MGRRPIAPDVKPGLAVKARLQTDKVSGEPVLLYPEGVLMLNTTGAAIIKLCDGRHTVSEIVAELAQGYKVSPDALRDDVNEYLARLYRHSLIVLPHVESQDNDAERA
jgi:pyrroloquinoline quinone biosynthesis protein D